jgi:hypothetical protein
MRKLIMAAAILLWTLPAYAQLIPLPRISPIPILSVCCQKGDTYGASAFPDLPSCEEIPIFDKCEGGKVVAGTCQADGACSGATVCCQGVSIGEVCSPGLTPPGGSPTYTAQPDTCAPATESACDAKTAAGGQATRSVAGGTCINHSCSLPAPPLQ